MVVDFVKKAKRKRLGKCVLSVRKTFNTVAGFRQHHGGGHGHHVLYHGAVLGYQARHMPTGHHHISAIPAHSSIPLNASE